MKVSFLKRLEKQEELKKPLLYDSLEMADLHFKGSMKNDTEWFKLLNEVLDDYESESLN